MIVEAKNLPADITALREIIYKQNEIIQRKNFEIKELRKIVYGHRTEKRSAEDIRQGLLFNEAEHTKAKAKAVETSTVKSHSRKKRGRKPIPDHLPVKETIHDLPEDQKTCDCGKKLHRIGEDVTKELHFIPARLEVEKHITYKYACRTCEGADSIDKPGVLINKPKRLLPGSIASPSLLTYIIVSKYKDALPLYRLEGIFKRLQIRISRTSMANWMIRVSEKLSDLKEMLFEELDASPVVSMDETPLQVLKEPGRAAQSKSYMWCARNYEKNPIVIYHYSPSRSSTVINEVLPNFSGILLSDGYAAYAAASKDGRFVNAGCHVHARRNFIQAAEEGSPDAQYIISLYALMFQVEAHAKRRARSYEQLLKLRQRVSKPLFAKILDHCKSRLPETFGASPIGKAYRYVLKFEKALCVFLEQPNVPMDNNRTENDIRPFVIGRKNWLFSDSPAGANASSFWYSIIETAAQNGHNVSEYLLYLLSHYPQLKTREEKYAILPHVLDPKKTTAAAETLQG